MTIAKDRAPTGATYPPTGVRRHRPRRAVGAHSRHFLDRRCSASSTFLRDGDSAAALRKTDQEREQNQGDNDPHDDQPKRARPKEPIRPRPADNSIRRGGVWISRIITGHGTGSARRTQVAVLETGRWRSVVDPENLS